MTNVLRNAKEGQVIMKTETRMTEQPTKDYVKTPELAS